MVKLLPLGEAGCGDQAAAFLEGLAVRGGLGDGLGASVDGREAFEVGEAFSEERERDQSPAQLRQLALAAVAALADDGLHAGGRDVVVPRRQLEVIDLRGVEGLGDLLLVGFAIVAAADGSIHDSSINRDLTES
jgi:hypothetical protein